MLKPKKGKFTASEYGKLKAFLATHGFTGQWMNKTIGAAHGGRMRKTVNTALIAGLNKLPRA